MKITSSFLASLLVSVTVARPRALADDGTVPQKSRVTAFVIDDKGMPSVECWEISNMVDTMSTHQRADGSQATSHSIPVARSGELDGIDILTWPTFADIWPPSPAGQKASAASTFGFFSLFSVQSGLLKVDYRMSFGANSDDDDEVETHIFSLENGDDWFYFEDGTSDSVAHSAASNPADFHISTISGSETELLGIRYSGQPKHKVIHKGACKFTGLSDLPDESVSDSRASRKHSPLTVQVTVEDL